MNKLFLALAAMLSVLSVQPEVLAHTQVETSAIEFQLNHQNLKPLSRNLLGTDIMKGRVYSKKCSYNFATQGGAVGAVNLKNEAGGDCKLPKSAIVQLALIDVLTAPTSGGSATVALGTGQAANDIKAATAIASLTGIVAGVPVGTAATAVKLTADRVPTATIATAALTAGKINVLFQYVISE